MNAFNKRALDQQVQRRPTATTHALRIGDGKDGSTPLGEITPLLAGPEAARYHHARSLDRLGLAKISSAIGTSDSFNALRFLQTLNTHLGEVFLIDSRFHDLGVLVFRSDFQRSLIEDVVTNWDSNNLSVGGRNAFQTDGQHSFFKDAVLLSTCAFSIVLLCWVPLQFTVLLGQDTEHHRVHFKRLNDVIVELVKREGLQNKKEYLLHVRTLVGVTL